MTAQTAPTRDETTARIYRLYADFYKISGGLLLVGIGIWIGSLLFSDGYATNVYTEVLSVIATILVLDRLNDWRETQRLKRRLVREAGSKANNTAVSAIDWMRAEGWLTVDDDVQLLKGADVSGANLKEADLNQGMLKSADLEFANLEGVNLGFSDLERAKLAYTQLKNASLIGANLVGANLEFAKMEGADLSFTDLEGAQFSAANLEGADLSHANLNNTIWQREIWGLIFTATLPDGSEWTPETDMTRFTDPDHPDFWQPYKDD